MSGDRTLTVTILGDAGGATRAFAELGNASQNFSRKLSAVGSGMKSVGSTMTASLTLPIVGLGAVATKSAVDFETAFAGVRKTVDATETEFAVLRRGIRDMAKELPASTTEIAAVAEAAGQLGIQKGAILSFTKTMIDLGETTNLSSDQAATSLARLANITQMPQENFSRLGSVVVELGNKLASTEAEIVEMGLRLAGAGKTIGLTEAQILGLAGALSSVGIDAEAGGTAFSKVMISISAAAAKGGKELDQFAAVAGQSSAEFAKSFEEDPATAIVAFVEGLGRIQKSGGDLFGTLEKLGVSEVRMRDALLRSAGAGDLMRQSLDLGTEAWRKNNALTKEAEERYKTFAARFDVLKNQFKDVAITLGEALMPVLEALMPIAKSAAEVFGSLAQRFADLNPTVQTIILAFAGVVAAIGPVVFILGTMAAALAALAGPAGVVIVAIAGVVAAGAALAAGFTVLYQESETFRNAAQGLATYLAGQLKAAVDTVTSAYQRNKPEIDRVVAVIRDQLVPILGVAFAAFAKVAGFLLGAWIQSVGAAVTAIVQIIAAVGRVIEAVGQLKSGVESSISGVAAVFRALPGQIVAALGDVDDLLFDVGKSIIKGLIRGISSGIGELKKKLGEITDMIPKVKGPAAKDARLLQPAGQLIMTGLINGITSQIPALEATLSNVTGTVSGNQTALIGAAASGGSAAPSGAINHFHFPNYRGNDAELIAMISEGLRKQARQNGRVASF